MVLKGSKGNVATGGTLRAPRSHHLRLYAAQPVIQRHTRLHSATDGTSSTRCLDVDAETGYVATSFQTAVDDGCLSDRHVVYSLNKKGRWKLPELLKATVFAESGEYKGSKEPTQGLGDYDVTLIERHKLSRPSNCIEAFSTRAPNGTLRSKRKNAKKYFNPKGLLGESGSPSSQPKPKGNGRRVSACMAKVQQDGVVDDDEELTNEVPAKPELVYEVFYPSPSTSAVSHNPKFIIDDHITTPDEIRHRSSGRNKRAKHRASAKAKTLGNCSYGLSARVRFDADDYSLANRDANDAMVEWGIEESNLNATTHWPHPSSCFEEDLGHEMESVLEASQKDTDHAISDSPLGDYFDPPKREDCTFSSIFEVAFKSKSDIAPNQAVGGIRHGNASRRRKQSGRCCHNDKEGLELFHSVRCPKLKVVGVEDDQDEATKEANVTSSVSSSVADLEVPRPEMRPVVAKVFSEDLSSESMTKQDGLTVEVASSLPPRLLVDVTDRVNSAVQEAHGLYKYQTQRLDLDTFLVVEPGAVGSNTNDDGSTIGLDSLPVRVTLSTNYNTDLVSLPDLSLHQVLTMEGLVETAVKMAAKLPLSGFCTKALPVFGRRNKMADYLGTFSLVQSALHQTVRCQTPDQAFDSILKQERRSSSSPSRQTQSDLCSQLQVGVPCGICYVLVSLDLHGLADATALRSCSHWFCNACWLQYLVTEINNGVPKITCPEYKCSSVVDWPTIKALVGLRIFRRHVQFVKDISLGKNPYIMWCPNEKCGRVMSMELATGVVDRHPLAAMSRCTCSQSACFLCKNEAHWPMSCDVARMYIQKLKFNRDFDIGFGRSVGVRDYVLHVKCCPHCHHPISKNGGCPYMACRCGNAFCWTCGKPYTYGTHTCQITSYRDQAYKRGQNGLKRMVLEYIDSTNVPQQPDAHRSHFYIRAVQHRRLQSMRNIERYTEMALKLAEKYKDVKSINGEGARSVSGSEPSSEQGTFFTRQCIATIKTRQDITKYFLSVVDLIVQLHHLAEHTVVLLEDKRYFHLKQWLEQLDFICSSLHQILEDEGAKQTSDALVRRLVHYEEASKELVKKLVRREISTQIKTS